MERGKFNNIVGQIKVAPSTEATAIRGGLVLRDPLFKVSRWIGVFNLNTDLKLSYQSLARGILLFLIVDIERTFFISYFITTKNIKAATFISVFLYNINWIIALFKPRGSLVKALVEFSLILQQMEVTYKSSWFFLTPLVLMLAKFIVTSVRAATRWGWLFEMAHLLMALPTVLLLLQYAAMTRHCAQAFTGLHKRLPAAGEEEIQKLAAVHCRLCRLSDQMNSHYGPSILVTVCIIIALSMSFVYVSMHERYVYVFNNLTVKAVARMILRIGYVLTSTLCVIVAANQVRKEADEFNNVLRNILIFRRLTNEDKLRVYFEMGMVVKPTACGFFNLKPTLLVTILAGLISYTVILLQFSGKSKIPLNV